MISYRELPANEYQRLHECSFYPKEVALPIPFEGLIVVVAEENDKIIGLVFLQGQVHADPFIIEEGHRKNGTALGLFNSAIDIMKERGIGAFFVLTDKPEASRVLQRAGMDKIYCDVFMGKIQ